MALDYPSPATTGQIFTAAGSSWRYDGTKWVAYPGPGGYVLKAGDTMSGNLTVSTTGWSAFNLRSNTGNRNLIAGYIGASQRWELDLGDGTAESSGNAGSNFALYSFNDAGGFLGTPLTINRATGGMTLSNTLSITPSGDATLVLNKTASGNSSLIVSNTGGSGSRWGMYLGDNTAESGGNAGSNFDLNRSTDAGAYLGTPLSIARSTGIATFASPIVNGSDRRLKEDIEPVMEALAIVQQLQGVYYKPVDGVRRQVGLIAQDVLPALPEVVFETGQPRDAKGDAIEGDPLLGIAYPNIVAVLVNAVKELSARLEALEVKAPSMKDRQ